MRSQDPTTFVNAMRPLIDSGPNTNLLPFTTSSGVWPGTGGQLLTIGALKYALTSMRRVTPFVVGGAGITSRFGELPTAGVRGHYAARFGFPECLCGLSESDVVQFRVSEPSRGVVGMLGIGFDYQPGVKFWRGRAENSSRWGIRMEARAYIGSTESETFVDTRPSFETEPPDEFNLDYPVSGVLVVGAAPAAQFSNDPPVHGFRIEPERPAPHELPSL